MSQKVLSNFYNKITSTDTTLKNM